MMAGLAAVMAVGLLSLPSRFGARASAGTGGGGAVPPGRGEGGLAPDPTGNVLLFGGLQTETLQYLGDTWVWDGASWTEQHPTDSPDARGGFGMAYDGARHQVVLFG